MCLSIDVYSVIRRAWKRVENLQRQICVAEENSLVYSEVRRVELHDNSEYVSVEIQSNKNTNFMTTVNQAYGIIHGPS